MNKIVFSPAAQNDLDGIWDYTAQNWGIAQAEKYTDDIRDACQALASGSKRGLNVDLRENYLKLTIRRHLIFFREHEYGIEVVRILHQRMNVQRYLQSDNDNTRS